MPPSSCSYHPLSHPSSPKGLTDNHNRLLHLISLHSHQAVSEDDREEWIRKQALLVL